MKNLVIICLLLVTVTIQAQPGDRNAEHPRKEMRKQMKNLTPEQRAELKTKKMTLHLDLNESQQVAIQKINLQQALKRENFRKEKEKNESRDDKATFEKASSRLDEKIALKKEMQAILTAEQFEKFEKMHRRMGKKQKQGRKQHKR